MIDDGGLSRKDDLDTAKQAASELRRKKKIEQYRLIIYAFRNKDRLTHEEIGKVPGVDTRAHRTRCNELRKDYGVLELKDKEGVNESGKRVARWGLTFKGRELL